MAAQDIVTKDGKLHLDDPKVREAAIKALTYPATAYKEGFVPPGAINWNDADDNNAFHAKTDRDGSRRHDLDRGRGHPQRSRITDDIVTMGLPLSNDGKPVPSQVANAFGLIPKGAKNVEVAKDFLKYLIQPKVSNAYLKTGLGRNIPAMMSIVKNDPWWLDPADPHRAAYVQQGLLGPTTPDLLGLQPGLCPGPERACLERRLDRHHDRRHDAARPPRTRRSSASRRSSRNTRS